MADFYKLRNQIKHYEWGSLDLMPGFLGTENSEGKPWAEMWMGTHCGAPSSAEIDGNKTSLRDIVAGNSIDASSGELPFLFKLLAAGKPLSIQAHPNLKQAREGFKKENDAGYSLDGPKRNYKDPNHKPEIVCALTPFTVMCGFRKPVEIRSMFEAFLSLVSPMPQFSRLKTVLELAAAKPLMEFFKELFNMPGMQRNELTAFFNAVNDGKIKTGVSGAISGEQWKLMRNFASQFPGDPAIFSPVYLNLFTLEPGQAVFLPAGILHSYISGLAVELMVSSDNVLRGGLTFKNIDIPELIKILDFSPFMPQIFEPPSSASFFRYPAPCNDFSLFYLRSGGEKIIFPENGPAVCIVTSGDLLIGGNSLKKGESFFVPCRRQGSAPLSLEGNYSLFAAAAGETAASKTTAAAGETAAGKTTASEAAVSEASRVP